MPKRQRPSAKTSIKRQRPVWWTQEHVLARLQSGEFIMDICQASSTEMADAGIQLALSTLRAEVSGWAESASWGPQLTAALKLWKRTSSGQMVLSKAWHDDFLAAMETVSCAGNAMKAAAYAGVGYGVVLAVLDKRNKCYDPEFAEKFKIAELDRVGRIRERYMDTAESGEGKAASRAQERIIESALPALHGTKQELLVSGNVDHEHTHMHGIAAGLAREIVAASQRRIQKLQAGRQGLLPDDTGGVTIDVTPTKSKVTVPA